MEVGVLLAQNSGGSPFEVELNLIRRQAGWGVQKKVDLVWHDLESHDLRIQNRSLLLKQPRPILFDRNGQNLAPALWAPDKVTVDE